jgi:putative heme-binding domain-containing protein
MTGGFEKTVVVEGINAEAGEQIFFGKGKCWTCHSIGDQGSAIRCPNLGVMGENFKVPIGERASERAAKRSKETGKHFEAVDYLFECIADPSAFIVPGFKNEMPFTYKAPIGLTPDEVKAVVVFLAEQGGDDIPMSKILNPTGIAKEMFAKVEAAHAGDGSQQEAPFTLYMEGDPEEGKTLFWDLQSKAGCAKCHSVDGKGGKVGPDLTSVSGTRTLPYIVESVVKPSAVIVSGYSPILILTNDGERISGTNKEETDEHFMIGLANGEVKKIMKSDVKKFKIMKKSIMPGNFSEVLSIDDFHNLMAYVQTLTGAAPTEPAKEETPAAEKPAGQENPA